MDQYIDLVIFTSTQIQNHLTLLKQYPIEPVNNLFITSGPSSGMDKNPIIQLMPMIFESLLEERQNKFLLTNGHTLGFEA